MEKIEKNIIELLQNTNRIMSLREITIKLEKNYGIKKSPQVVLKHLIKLKKEGQLEELK